MPQVINTNILSLTAQRNLNNTQSALATAMQRLSSGLRINSAKDDAAGLAIATRFTTQINGLNTAVRNANDGISLAQTTGSALAQVTANLQAIRTLAVQSANATNSSSDRSALDNEVQQRLSEITRIARQTTFNGRHVLDGNFGNAAFQVGANVGETITVNLSQGTAAADIGGVATVSQDVSGAFTTAAVAATAGSVAAGAVADPTGAVSFDIDGTTVSVAAGSTNLTDLVTSVNSAMSTAGLDYTASVDGTGIKLVANTAGADPMTVDNLSGITFGAVTAGTAAVPAGSTSLTFGATDFSVNGTFVQGKFDSAQSLADGINAASIEGVSAYVDGSGNLAIQSNSDDAVTIGGSGTNFDALGFTAGATQAGGSLADADVLTVADANDVINRVDAALTTVSGVRSELGAIQNRFDSTISNLQAISENLSASRSRIQDADFAKETAQLSRAQILQQAGVAMLAQANVAPQTVLKLLQ